MQQLELLAHCSLWTSLSGTHFKQEHFCLNWDEKHLLGKAAEPIIIPLILAGYTVGTCTPTRCTETDPGRRGPAGDDRDRYHADPFREAVGVAGHCKANYWQANHS